MGIGPLCRLFGKSRQSYYDRRWHFSDQEKTEVIAIELVQQVRRELPGMGIHKLYKCLFQPLKSHGLKIGRDRLLEILRKHKMLITSKGRRNPKTTQSNHWFRRYPDLAKSLVVTHSEQLWVSDITFICISYDFNYLSLITDAYSKKIVGYCLHHNLKNEGSLKALKMAILGRSFNTELIHHSDRGVQYCSYDYTQTLKNNDITISTTQNGEAYENAIAERVNGILKTEFNLNQVFKSRAQALLKVNASIDAYNNLRPHMSCSFLTPEQAHFAEEPLIKHWKNRRNKTIRNLENRAHEIPS